MRRVEFSFGDTDRREREITRQFFRDTDKPSSPRAALQGRRLMASALYRAKSSDSRRCTAEALARRLWDEQHATLEPVTTESQATLRAAASGECMPQAVMFFGDSRVAWGSCR
jgi:hypothetical protein